MNTQTGEIRRFSDDEYRKLLGYNERLTEGEATFLLTLPPETRDVELRRFRSDPPQQIRPSRKRRFKARARRSR